MEQNRREFLKSGGKLLVLTASAAAAWEYVLAGQPEAAPGYQTSEHWWAMAIDIDACIGCGLCARACKDENDVPDDPRYFRTWIERYRIDPLDRDHPHVDSPNGGCDGFEAEASERSERATRAEWGAGAPASERVGGPGGAKPPGRSDDPPGWKSFFVPKLCNHCVESPCVQVCPVGATFRSEDGVVLVDKDYCLGCRYCVQACPYGCRFIDPRTHTADKCSLCYHRITRGLLTACCEVCPTGARQLADLKDPNDPIHEFLRTKTIQVLKPQMATQSKVYYSGLDGAVR